MENLEIYMSPKEDQCCAIWDTEDDYTVIAQRDIHRTDYIRIKYSTLQEMMLQFELRRKNS